MKKLILLSSFLLVVCMCAFAQTDSDASSASTTNMKPIQGCLSSSSQGKYILTDSSGNDYMLSGQTAGLDNSVGHQVNLMGTEMHVEAHSATGTDASQDKSMSENTASMHHFKVHSFKDTGSTCSASGSSQH
ncbi:MAG TPA: hypothetical protein VMT82_03565 [candidate division Zixibacteria bacterium]|nr:hypothetical protein [candidate division Zixibacteria bacterium]